MSAEKVIPEELWNSLNSLDPLEVSRRSLACYEKKIRGYILKTLNDDYLIFPEKKIIETADSPSLPSLDFYFGHTSLILCPGEEKVFVGFYGYRIGPIGPFAGKNYFARILIIFKRFC